MSSSVHSGHSGKEHLPRTAAPTTTTTGRGRVKAFETEDFSDDDDDDDDFIEEEGEEGEEGEGMEEEGAKYNNSRELQLQQQQQRRHEGANATSNSSSHYNNRNQVKKEEGRHQQEQQGEVFPTIAYNNLGKQTNFSQCLTARAKKWNPMKQFEPAKTASSRQIGLFTSLSSRNIRMKS